jgi:hypothetical protein
VDTSLAYVDKLGNGGGDALIGHRQSSTKPVLSLVSLRTTRSPPPLWIVEVSYCTDFFML